MLRRWDSIADTLSLWRRANARNVSYFTLYVGQFTFSTQLLTLNYLICVQLRSKEMVMKRIVTNKREKGTEKAWISYYNTCFAVFSVVKPRTPTAVIIAIFEFGNTFSFVYARIVDAWTLFPKNRRKLTLSSQIKMRFDNNQKITHSQELLGPLSQE